MYFRFLGFELNESILFYPQLAFFFLPSQYFPRDKENRFELNIAGYKRFSIHFSWRNSYRYLIKVPCPIQGSFLSKNVIRFGTHYPEIIFFDVLLFFFTFFLRRYRVFYESFATLRNSYKIYFIMYLGWQTYYSVYPDIIFITFLGFVDSFSPCRISSDSEGTIVVHFLSLLKSCCVCLIRFGISFIIARIYTIIIHSLKRVRT